MNLERLRALSSYVEENSAYQASASTRRRLALWPLRRNSDH